MDCNLKSMFGLEHWARFVIPIIFSCHRFQPGEPSFPPFMFLTLSLFVNFITKRKSVFLNS